MQRKVRLSGAPVVMALGVIVIGALVLAQTNGKSSSGKSAPARSERAAPTKVASTEKNASVASERKPLSHYLESVREDLFAPPAPPAPKPANVTPLPAIPVTAPAPAPVNPFADFAYTGTVAVGDRTMALIENTKTKEGQYLGVGDSFMGGTVAQIDERIVTVSVAGKPQVLAKTDNFKLTPLDKNAPYLDSQRQQPGQPGAAPQPGQPGGPMPAMMGGGMPFPNMDRLPQGVRDRFRQRWERMSPEERERATNRMLNRRFEGGGRRGGGER
jgi:hypothetical protein